MKMRLAGGMGDRLRKLGMVGTSACTVSVQTGRGWEGEQWGGRGPRVSRGEPAARRVHPVQTRPHSCHNAAAASTAATTAAAAARCLRRLARQGRQGRSGALAGPRTPLRRRDRARRAAGVRV